MKSSKSAKFSRSQGPFCLIHYIPVETENWDWESNLIVGGLVWAVGCGAQLPKCPSKPTPGAMYHSGLNSLSFSTEIRKIFHFGLQEIFHSRLEKIFQ